MRLKFCFWLDQSKADEKDLIKAIGKLKEKKQFAPTVRLGIALVVSLRKKDPTILLSEFDWIKEWVLVNYGHEIPKQASESHPVAEQLTRLENLILQRSASSAIIPLEASSSTIKRKSATSDDDLMKLDFEVKTATSNEDNKSNFNFAISSALAVFGNADSLPDEVIEYGLRTNRLQPHHVTRQLKSNKKPSKQSKQKRQQNQLDDISVVDTSASGNAKKLEGSDIEFAPPNYDDDDLLAQFG